MTTRTITLVAVEDEYDSEPGLAPKGMDTKFEGFMAARSGFLVAHDVLEHLNGCEAIGGVPDELEALGALWQVRGRHGDMLNKDRFVGSAYTAEEHVAFDISRMATELTGEAYWPGSTHIEPEPEHLFDDEFRSILTYARRNIEREGDATEIPEDFDVDIYLEDALHLMRRGFRKAESLYGEGFGGHDLFIAVRNAVDRELARTSLYDGQEFTLTIGEDFASFDEVFPEPEDLDDDEE
ncbi:hypothetical protein [Sphingomonas sp. ACRSK]|uniref:hypothetical protein n=1 Tax=Sphingomonas sp. ACRSK TaxID=2918213 RepID=UPI001EF6CD08|nr:hypothetical protein [Sphingomonas sp. ACRSK]MCG7348844.1 hypothetical protein [Sphingomonas sp. ACRSK]